YKDLLAGKAGDFQALALQILKGAGRRIEAGHDRQRRITCCRGRAGRIRLLAAAGLQQGKGGQQGQEQGRAQHGIHLDDRQGGMVGMTLRDSQMTSPGWNDFVALRSLPGAGALPTMSALARYERAARSLEQKEKT